MEISDLEQEVSVTVMASLLGISAKKIDRLVQDGVLAAKVYIIHGRSTRRYPVKDTVQTYIRHVTNTAAGTDEKLIQEGKKLRAETRLKESQAELHELKTKLAAGEYVSKDVLKEDYTNFFVQLRTFLLGIPGRVTGIVAGDISPQRARQLEHELSEDIKTQMRSFVVANNGPEVVEAPKRRSRKKAVKAE